jgi:hypothetical protein
MDDTISRNFVSIVSSEGKVLLVNLAQVRMVDEIEAEHCRLWFSEVNIVDASGPGATTLIKRLTERSIDLNGSPLDLAMKQAESQ